MAGEKRKKEAGDEDERRGLRATREHGGQLCPPLLIYLWEGKRQIDKGINYGDALSTLTDLARPPTMATWESGH